jgi:hypothetical protein
MFIEESIARIGFVGKFRGWGSREEVLTQRRRGMRII